MHIVGKEAAMMNGVSALSNKSGEHPVRAVVFQHLDASGQNLLLQLQNLVQPPLVCPFDNRSQDLFALLDGDPSRHGLQLHFVL